MTIEIQLNTQEIQSLITRNTVLVDKLNERLRELESLTYQSQIDPSIAALATQRVTQNEVSHLMNELATVAGLLAG